MRRRLTIIVVLALGALVGGLAGASAHARPRCHTVRVHGHRHRVCRRVTHRPTTTTRSGATSTSYPSSVTPSATGPVTTPVGSTTMTASTTTTIPGTHDEVDVDDGGYGATTPYSMVPVSASLPAGTITFDVYNNGQGTHTFQIQDSTGRDLLAQAATLPAGTPATPTEVTVALSAGTYRIYCILSGHAMRGMQATITVH